MSCVYPRVASFCSEDLIRNAGALQVFKTVELPREMLVRSLVDVLRQGFRCRSQGAYQLVTIAVAIFSTSPPSQINARSERVSRDIAMH